MQATRTRVPSIAAGLGALGALPFVALAAATPFCSGPPRTLIVHALAAYGATILSFLGGVHWGLAIGSDPAQIRGSLAPRLILSVLPSLVGWAALLGAPLGPLAPKGGLWLLAAAIAIMLWVDLQATRQGHAPAWYPRLRIPLSLVVVATLVAAACV